MDSRDRFVRAGGWLVLVGSLIGALCAVIIIGWPQEVPPSRYSHPFGPTSYVVAQLLFAVRDATQVVGLLGLCVLARGSSSRLTRVGLVGAVLGMVLFAAAELFALTAVDAATASARADLVDAAYAPPMLLFGASAVVAEIGLARSQVLPGVLGRWVVLAVGGYVFVPLFPAVFAPAVVGRLAIGVWLLLFAGIGVAVLRAVAVPVGTRREPVTA